MFFNSFFNVGGELDYIFDTAELSGANFTQEESSLSNSMLSYWIAFVKGDATSVGWPLYDPSIDNNLAFDVPETYILDNWRKEQCDFWDSWGYYATVTN